MATIKLSLLDGSILMQNSMKASKDKEIGWGDTRFSLGTWKYVLGGEFTVRQDLVETGLWCAKMLEEKGEFFHPEGLTFDQFLKRMTPAGWEYDPLYCEFKKIGE